MAPTRELVVQIGKDIRMFTRALDFTCVCAYGGSAVGDQISALKRGAEVGLEHSHPNPPGTLFLPTCDHKCHAALRASDECAGCVVPM